MRFVTPVLFTLLLLIGCKDNMTNSKSDSQQISESAVQTDVTDLSHLISLPKRPKTVRWQVTPQPGARDASLIALMRFSDEDYDFIIAQSHSFDTESDEVVSVNFYHNWLEDVLGDSPSVQPQGEYVVLKGVYAMESNLFTQAPRSPYVNGRVIPLGKGLVALNLYSM